MEHRLEFARLSQRLFAPVAIQCSFVTACELITTVNRNSIGRPTSISGGTSTSGGTINAGAGGQASSATNSAGNGGVISSSGGATSMADDCNGLRKGHACGMNEIEIQVDAGIAATAADAGSPCDLPLQNTPTVSQDRLLVVIDCVAQPVVPAGTLDASAANGFSVDYNQEPAHLLFHGTCCKTMQAQGTHVVDIIVGCGCCD